MQLKSLKISDLHKLDLMVSDLIKEFGNIEIRDIQQRICDEINFRYKR